IRNLFAVPRLVLNTLVSILAAVILVFSIFGLLRINSGKETPAKETPAKELLTGSIQRSHGVIKPASNDPLAAFIAPDSNPKPQPSAVMDRGIVPLPRPRPKRI